MADLSTIIVETTGLDLDSYAANYTGNTRIQRLVFIGDRCPSLRLDAYRLALKDLQDMTHDTKRMLAVADKLREVQRLTSVPLVTLDKEHLGALERQTATRTERLELELKNYKNNLIKESIRMGYNDLGDHYYKRGDLDSALKCFVRTRDYCTSAKHITQMCLNVIRVSIELGTYSHVITYANKALATQDVKKEPLTVAKLTCAAALYYLHRAEYRQAAQRFIEVSFDVHNHYTDVISSQDVGIYGSLCALATFDRAMLKLSVLENTSFRQFLELCPEMRTLLTNFVNSRYSACFSYLDSLKHEMQLDLHLYRHMSTLLAHIRKKALIQYCTPFTSVDLGKMAEAFRTNVIDLESELAGLIVDKEISARIDSQNKVLHARHVDQRAATFQHALAAGRYYERYSKMALLRLNMASTNFIVRAEKPSTTTV